LTDPAAERLAAEGQNSPADLLFTVDAGRLSEAKDAGLTQKVDDAVLTQTIPVQFRDPGSHWFGTDYLGRDLWARVIYGGRVSLPVGLGVVAIEVGEKGRVTTVEVLRGVEEPLN